MRLAAEQSRLGVSRDASSSRASASYLPCMEASLELIAQRADLSQQLPVRASWSGVWHIGRCITSKGTRAAGRFSSDTLKF